MTTYAILGGGNMGSAIACGLIRSGEKPSNITISDIDKQLLQTHEQLGVKTCTDNKEAIAKADILFVVVKPYLVENILKEIKSVLSPTQIVVSVAAGVSIREMESILGNQPLFIAIPNTAIAIGESFTALSTRNGTPAQQELLLNLLNKMGSALLVDESLLGATTVLASCGIAFAMRFIRAAILGGIETGLKPHIAKQIAAQITKGAGEIILQHNSNPEDEIDKVSTPKGITITGLNEMEKNGFSAALIKGINKAFEKVEKKS